MKNHPVIIHVDPAIGSTNLGDEIISEAVARQINIIFPSSRRISISSRDVGIWSRGVLDKAACIFFGGSNALTSNPLFGYRQLSMGRFNAFDLSRVILLGVGWWQYQDQFGPFAKSFYKKLLRNDCVHSVRDEYTKRMLNKLGFENVLNTSCPTMWGLESFQEIIGNTAVITLTDYNPERTRDLEILRNASAKFETLHYWPQGCGDLDYLASLSREIDIRAIRILDPTLAAFDQVLLERPCYVGTRLHGGIRALQFKCPAFIVPIDNRAVEIAKTENLPLVEPTLTSVVPGAAFHFTYSRNAEIDKYLKQFIAVHE